MLNSVRPATPTSTDRPVELSTGTSDARSPGARGAAPGPSAQLVPGLDEQPALGAEDEQPAGRPRGGSVGAPSGGRQQPAAQREQHGQAGHHDGGQAPQPTAAGGAPPGGLAAVVGHRAQDVGPVAGPVAGAHPCASRGRRWQRGQRKDDRFMKCSRTTSAPQRRQGSPVRPYTASSRSKYPLSPLTLT